MSYVKSSALRWFESILENTRRKLAIRRKRSLFTITLEKLVNLGDIVFPRLIYIAGKIAIIVSRLQITMIESMILASLWSGFTILLIVVLITYMAF